MTAFNEIQVTKSITCAEFERLLGEIWRNQGGPLLVPTHPLTMNGSRLRLMQLIATWAVSRSNGPAIAITHLPPNVGAEQLEAILNASPHLALLASASEQVLAVDRQTNLMPAFRAAFRRARENGVSFGRAAGHSMLFHCGAASSGCGRPLYASKDAVGGDYRPIDLDAIATQPVDFQSGRLYQSALADMAAYFGSSGEDDIEAAPGGAPRDSIEWFREILFETMSNAHHHGAYRMLDTSRPGSQLALEYRLGPGGDLKDDWAPKWTLRRPGVPILVVAILDTGPGIALHHKLSMSPPRSATQLPVGGFESLEEEADWLKRAVLSRYRASGDAAQYGLGLMRILAALDELGGSLLMRTGRLSARFDFSDASPAHRTVGEEFVVSAIDASVVEGREGDGVGSARVRGTLLTFYIPLVAARPELM